MILNGLIEGHWFTPDPLGGDITNPQSLNRYAYALNNPTTLTDPMGLDPSNCTAGTDADGNPIVNCSGPDTVTVNGGTPPNIPTLGGGIGECPFYGCVPNCSIFTCGPMPGQPGGSGGGGSGSAPAPKPAPIQTFGQRLACAANFGDAHSFAGLLGIQGNLVGNLFLGNSVSGVVELGQTVFGSATPTGGQIATTLLGGAGQGVPVVGEHPGVSGAAGIVQDAFVKAGVNAAYNTVRGVGAEPIELGLGAAGQIATPVVQLSSETLSSLAFGVGAAKFGWDLSTFAVGAIRGCQQ